MSTLKSLLLGVLSLAIIAAGCSSEKPAGERVASVSAPLAVTSWPDAGLVAKNSIAIAANAQFRGDIAVINRATGAVLNAAGVELELGRSTIVTGNVKADTLSLLPSSRIDGNAAFNARSGAGTISGTATTTLTLPLPITLPALPTITPGTTAVTVAASATRTLAAGAFAAVKANAGAALTLSGGTYHFTSLTLGVGANLFCTSACEVRVQQGVDLAANAFVGPASGTTIGASDVQLLIGLTSASPTGTPAIQVGNGARVDAYVLAPNGTADVKADVTLNGKLIAKDVGFARGVVGEAYNLPLINTQPADLSINELQTATFTVAASGKALKYQWFRGNNAITGATTASFTLADPVPADNGATFRVRVSNLAGSVLSRFATLSVRTCLAVDTSCNGIDDDCNGQIDEDYVSTSTQCGVGACKTTGSRVCVNGTERDTCTPKPPAPNDATCNGIDDDCSGQVDEDYLPHATACGVGTCAAQGNTSCVSGQERDSCSPGIPAPNDAQCDGLDQDCSGTSDEDFVSTPTTCGVGACTRSGGSVCVSGHVGSTCLPGTPAANDSTCDGIDDDCDGQIDEDFVGAVTSCGSGACNRNGRTSCVAGHLQDSCQPGTPAANDATCDGIDANCNGQVDENYATRSTSCGQGACLREGATSCVAGHEQDSCQPGTAAANDATCNGIDDDCDGQVDEDYAAVATSCGVGACGAVGSKQCSHGVVVDSCQPGVPASADATCDGVDDDCDGHADEDYQATAVSCGVGACVNSGSAVCRSGAIISECTPKPAAAADASCNGVDDDCDGLTDEDFAPRDSSCGVGACVAAGTVSCSQGAEVDSCHAGAGATNDATCDGVDDDCDGQVDEDYAPEGVTCGLGACASSGQTRCEAGKLINTCIPGTAAATDATCDGVDDDCDGHADEDYAPETTTCGQGTCATTGLTRCEAGAVVSQCTAGSGAANDATCNGVDDDCDGHVDEDFVPAVISCGVGGCTQTGVSRCVGGQIQNECTPGTPQGTDDDCDGVDDDCDGQIDEGYAPHPTVCGQGNCRRDGVSTCDNGKLTDSCQVGTPSGQDETCDGIDSDCDGQIDEGYVPHAVSCGLGACRATGTSACSGGVENDACTPLVPLVTRDESCNGVDDDCDGATDEDFVGASLRCGVGACARSGTTVCAVGHISDDCTPGAPAAADTTCDGVDDDCDGQVDEDFVGQATSCGVGSCAATGSTQCVAGQVVDHCSPKAAAADDRTCNGVDDDCDGQVDEDYLATPTSCGRGACQASGTLTCQSGTEHDSCLAGTPATTDATCNGIDEDCDGQVDEDFAAQSSSCGVGACARQGSVTCVAGSPVDSCAPVAPAASDATCDGIDDDCDGAIDEDFSTQPISCGVGACAATGTRSCQGGAVHDSCTPLAQSGSDDDCDGIDDDCDGLTDEGFVGLATSCGDGACLASGVTSCVSGHIVDSCHAGSAGALDAVCDGVDADCDGQIDEDFVPTPTTCGVGACQATGTSSCVSGVEQRNCAPGAAATSDATCNGIDDDCDGQVDEDFVGNATHCGVGACATAGQQTCVGGHVVDSCAALHGAATDATCDGVDDDCDGQVDEDFVADEVACGVGACHATGLRACENGALVNHCEPRPAAANDASCNGVDDDCDGQVDEDYVVGTSECGVGACHTSGAVRCVQGQPVSECAPLEAAATDTTCNGVDDDCDGRVDEDFAPTEVECGIGACHNTGATRCQGGTIENDCAPHAAATEDTSCDGVDNDCDGSVDEDFVVLTTTCGTGACKANGNARCQAGHVVDDCQATAAASNDATCNGVDDDCDGQTDEDYAASTTTCGVGACTASGSTSCQNGHVVDSCAVGTSTTADTVCNGIDDDCDGNTDEDFVPAPSSCGVGACAAAGTTRCQAGHVAVECTPGTPAVSDTTCDGIDDDCDGQVDEDYVAQPTSCGVGACHATGTTSCSAGHEVNSCAPGTPAASDVTCNGVDDDCDGSVDEDYAAKQTSCGTGACVRAGSTTCQSGSEVDTCKAGTPAADDATCNGLDDDCDGSTDEEYVGHATSCGRGVCAAAGTTSCSSGHEVDSCVEGTPATSDSSCNGKDDDCDGGTDEDYQATPSSCGIGACARTGSVSCSGGELHDSCSAGTAAPNDNNCNDVDDDCDGSTDEDFEQTATTCGIGVCKSTGQKRCEHGAVQDSCAELQPTGADNDCDGVDNDCDGSVDEGFQTQSTGCGVGACHAEGVVTCSAGHTTDSCTPKPATAADTNCNGVDEDCDGTPDQGYVGAVISCGVGACAATGTTICVSGSVVNQCTPKAAATNDASCDNIDDDCDGLVDEDFGVRCQGSSVERCQQGSLQHVDCLDSNTCNGEETCNQGACKAGSPPSIDDHDPCTTDQCDALSGISHGPAPRGTTCGTSKACDGAGACVGLPVISQQPQSATADPGQALTLVVAATGNDLSYQWRRFGQDIPGATSPTYTLSAVTLADNGVELAVVISNSAGSVVSAAAILTVRDSGAPSLVVDGPALRSVSTDFITLTGTALDPGGAVSGVSVTSALFATTPFAAVLNAATGAFSVEVPLKVGDNALTVSARDTSGNVTQSSILVKLTTDYLPTVQITEPAPNTVSATNLVTVRGVVRSSYEATAIRLRLGDQVAFPDGSDHEYTFEFKNVRLVSGANVLTVQAETTAGSATAQVVVQYGTSPQPDTGADPQLRLTGIQKEFFTTASHQLISGTVNATRCVASVTVNGAVATLKGSGTDVSFDYDLPLPSGDDKLDVLVRATDCDGRHTELSFSALHDDVAPVFAVSLTEAPAQHTFTQTPAEVTGSITEEYLAGLTSSQQSIGVLPAGDGKWDFSLAVPLVSNTTQSVTLEAWDHAGNRKTYTLLLHLDASTDIEVLSPVADSEVVSTDDPTTIDVVARVPGLAGDQVVVAALDTAPGIVLTRSGNTFSGSLQTSAATGKHALTFIAQAANGGALAQKRVTFSVKAAADIPLTGSVDEPLNGSQNIETNQPIVMSFNRPVALSELAIEVRETVHGKQFKPPPQGASFIDYTASTMIDVNRDNELVPGGVSLLPGGLSAVFYPSRDYGYGAAITVLMKKTGAEVARGRFDIRPLPTLLTGFVVDGDYAPLEGITVALPDLNLSTVTDRQGSFKFGYGNFSSALPTGRHRIVVNPGMQSSHYGTSIRYAFAPAGATSDLGANMVRAISSAEPFRLVSSGDLHDLLMSGNLNLDLSHAELLFPNGQRSGGVQAQPVFGPGIAFPRLRYIAPVFSVSIQPMGVEVAGETSLDMALPPEPDGHEYIGSLPERLLIGGVHNDSLEIVPVGVALVDQNTKRVKSEGKLLLERLDFITFTPLRDATRQALLARYGAGEIDLEQLIGALGAAQ